MYIHVTDNPTDSITFTEYTDEGQTKYGATAADFCGADRTYQIVDSQGNSAASFLSLSGDKTNGFTITLSSTDPADWTDGTTVYALKVTYTKPGGTTPIVYSDPFIIEIDACRFTANSGIANQAYTVSANRVFWGYSFTPANCPYTYAAYLVNGDSLEAIPSFVSFDITSTNQFSVFTT